MNYNQLEYEDVTICLTEYGFDIAIGSDFYEMVSCLSEGEIELN
jgi:hypothetical protein